MLDTAYSDTTSLPCIAAAVALLLASRTVVRRVPLMIATGLLLGLAIHSSPFNFMVSAVVVFAWLITEAPSRRWKLLTDLAVMAATVLALTGFAMFVYPVRFRVWNIIEPSLTALKSVSGEGGASFRSLNYDWTKYQIHLYLPFLALLAFAAANVRAIRKITAWELTSVLMLGGVVVMFATDQLIRGGTTLETYYYSSALMPALVLAAALHAIWGNSELPDLLRWGIVALIVALPLCIDQFAPTLEIDRVPAVPLFIVCTAGLALVGSMMWGRSANTRRSADIFAIAASMSLIGSTTLMLDAPPRDEPNGKLFNPH